MPELCASTGREVYSYLGLYGLDIPKMGYLLEQSLRGFTVP